MVGLFIANLVIIGSVVLGGWILIRTFRAPPE